MFASPLILQLPSSIPMTDKQFFELCQINENLCIEKSADRKLIIRPLTDAETSNRNVEIITQLGIWIEKDSTGFGFGSNTGFVLPNGAIRSSNIAWIKKERWEVIPLEQRQKFAPICPDFIIELRAEIDDLKYLQDKMQEFIENGTKLAWLIDRKERKVYIYRPAQPEECLENPEQISDESVLFGFILNMGNIW